MKREYEIMFDDLNKEAQERLLGEAGVSNAKEMNWDVFPVAIAYLPERGDDDDYNDDNNDSFNDILTQDDWLVYNEFFGN